MEYATAEFIAESDSKIAPFVKLSNMFPLEFANELWLRTIRRTQVLDDYVLHGIFVEGLTQSIRHSNRSYWSIQKDGLFPEFAVSCHVID